jgi:glycine/D-amino acid oxidase-like deaminating enzyme
MVPAYVTEEKFFRPPRGQPCTGANRRFAMIKNEISDVIVVGGGNIGSALAYGFARSGISVVLLDEGDIAYRGAFGNFGLVWFQGKGLGMQRYADWSLEATQMWPSFAERLEQESGVRIHYEKPGGLFLCRGERGLAERREKLAQLAQQSGSGKYDCEMIDRSELQRLMPRMRLGADITGASFSRHDGHCNPLYLIRALHIAFRKYGGKYHPGCAVQKLQHDGRRFCVTARKGVFEAEKLVLAAGVGIPALAAALGMKIPVRPQRGQLIVTERLAPMLPYPISGIRQTHEGSFMLGVSNEEVGFDTSVTAGVLKTIAKNAIDAFPALSGVRMVRSWAALRPLAPDQYPIYHQGDVCPGAYVVTSHSGVTLASVHADLISRWISQGSKPQGFEHFSLRRFDV